MQGIWKEGKEPGDTYKNPVLYMALQVQDDFGTGVQEEEYVIRGQKGKADFMR